MAGRGPIKKYPIGPILESFGFELPPGRTGKQKVRCAFHGDRTASAQVDYTNQRFRCFACHVSGDALDLIVTQEGVGLAAAVDRAEALAGGEVVPAPRAAAPPPSLFDRPRAGRARG